MKIETKYNIGDIFYCPRSYARTRIIEQEIDGYDWERREAYLSPEVKIIRIRSIGVEVDVDPLHNYIRYGCDMKRNIGDEWEEEVLRNYTEEILARAYDNYDQAWEKAQEYAIHKKQEYFG